MKKSIFAALAVLSLIAVADVPKPPMKFLNESDEARVQRLAWWQHDRFGMFIHFGLFAIGARHEWLKSYEKISYKDYDEKYPQYFNPDLFDAKDWARRAKAAGMKYVVLTTKHHEGFCMWDTKTTDFKITNTPFGRDLVREYVDALREEGLKVGLYYSIMDWHHPDYAVDVPHPEYRRIMDLPKEERHKKLDEMNKNRDMNRYREYMFAQVKELLTNYGKIDIIWFDYTPAGEDGKYTNETYGKSWQDWNAVELAKLTHQLQPGILIDSRLGLMDSDDGWDFVTPEQKKSAKWPEVRGKRVPWETCQTFSGSWGYYRDEMSWKSTPQLLELLIETVSKGGNLIMNVGPTGRGDFDYRAKDRLAGFENWMHFNSRSIYGCTKAPDEFVAPWGTMLTYNPELNRIYIHLIDYPMGTLDIEFFDRIKYVQFLHDASELKLRAPSAGHVQEGGTVQSGKIILPMLKPNCEVPVIEVFLK